jgi:hypothetical protein
MLIGLTEVLDVVTTSVTVAVCVNEPLVPVIVNVGLPVGVLLVVVTVSVEDPVPLTVEGENEAVAPVGSPLLKLRFTPLLKPFSAPTLNVYFAVLPGFTENELGVAVRLKSGAVTFIVTFTVCASSSVLVPVIATVALPPGVLADVVIVSVEVAPAAMEAGLNEADVPAGRLPTDKVTVPVKL